MQGKDHMDKTYYAKSPSSDGSQTTCKEHAQSVAKLAKEYAAVFGQGEAGKAIALPHDFGKWSEAFQESLHSTDGIPRRIDHAICGAVLLYSICKRDPTYIPLLEAINGHHDGLVSFAYLRAYLEQSMQDTKPVRCNNGKTAALAGPKQYMYAIQIFLKELPEFRPSNELRRSLHPYTNCALEGMLYTRMLFSCLVDADYSASATGERPEYLEETEKQADDPMVLLQRLSEHMERIRSSSAANKELDQIRDELFTRCGEAGKLPSGLYTLTAPTGTGKTLALLHFALQHCATHGKRRIILVLPFLALAEQSTAAYSDIIPYVLVDHSQSGLSEEAREYAARWSVPFIITTSVRFFETLFAQRPTDCRKLHSIADSVVIFDEAQSLPASLTTSTLQAVNTLCSQYRCTVLFSTASQPSYDALPALSWKPVEILQNHEELYRKLRRTEVEWRLDPESPIVSVADEMSRENSVCAIVNLRRHARTLYQRLKTTCRADELFFLTTDLCPDHRLAQIKRIKERLAKGLPCRIVATQCIEAGVDLDFECMYRALAPLDAILQAAGRCNRNGSLDHLGRVIVFVPQEPGRLYPDDRYSNAALLVKEMLSRGSLDIHDPKDITNYYTLLFQRATDDPTLLNAIAQRDYAATADAYQLIKTKGIRVLVPAPGKETLYARLREEALLHGLTKQQMREAAPITVTTFDEKLASRYTERLYYASRKKGERSPSDHFVLLTGHTDLYTEDMGLQFPNTNPNVDLLGY